MLYFIAVAGSVASLLMMAAGFVWLGVRRQFEVTRMSPEEAGDMVVRGWRGRPGWVWFRGIATGGGISASISTREIIEMLRQGRWGEALPWATPALGALAAFFFWPLLIGYWLGAGSVFPWALAVFFFGSAVYAAWPR